MFRFNENAESLLEPIAREEWALDEMKAWSEKDVTELLDIAQSALLDSMESMRLKADVIRKDRAVGLLDLSISPSSLSFFLPSIYPHPPFFVCQIYQKGFEYAAYLCSQ